MHIRIAGSNPQHGVERAAGCSATQDKRTGRSPGLVLARPCKPDGHKECPDGTGRHTEREGGSMTNAAQHKAMAEQSGSRRAACERFVR